MAHWQVCERQEDNLEQRVEQLMLSLVSSPIKLNNKPLSPQVLADFLVQESQTAFAILNNVVEHPETLILRGY